MEAEARAFNQRLRWGLVLVAVVGPGLVALAATAEPNDPGALFEMSIEDLMEIEVVSASRQGQRIGQLSVPVSIVTGEDIHYSGLRSINEILQFYPGVDLLEIGRGNYAVGVRGMHGIISDRLLTLVDGRAADNAIFGGPQLYRLPILPEDIERIEIVRGPGGAAWGANAFTGVINIITKDPEDTLGYFGSTRVTEFGDTFTHLRWGQKQNKWIWRVSAGFEDNKDSDDAIDGGPWLRSRTPALNALMGFGGFKVRDFSRNWRFDSKAVYQASEDTRLSLGAGYTNLQSGNYDVLGYWPLKDNRAEMLRLFTRLEREFADGSTGHLRWFGNITNENWASYGRYKAMENDVEAQYNFDAAENHRVSVGGNFRWIHIKAGWDTTQQYTYSGSPFDEHMAGLFLIDRWDLGDRWTIESQVRGDWYEETQTDWSGRLTALYALDQEKDHMLRFSAARAFRTPLIALRKARGLTLPILGMNYFNVLPPDDLHNEKTISLEAGYTGKLTERLTLRADTYYQRFSELIGYRTTVDGFGFQYYTPDNIDGADSWGGEVELALQDERGKLSLWYAYNDFEEDQSKQSVRSFLPAKHKTGITGRLFCGGGWTLNANYRFANTTPGNPSVGNDVAASHRLDLAVSKEFARGRGEVLVGVRDLLNKTHRGIYQDSSLTAHDTPGRMFFAEIQLKF